jgi:hypothetical protein
MKKIFNYLMAVAALSMAMVACQETPEEPEKVDPNYPSIEVIEETLAPLPTGEELEFDIEAEGAWKIEALDEYDWITVAPEEGEGNATLVFTVTANPTSKERSAEFEVKEEFEPSNADKLTADQNVTKAIKTYSFFVTQGKQESNLGEGTFEFLQAIVAGKMLGESTPEVASWFNVTESFPGISLDNFDGKLHITRIDGAPLTGWPEVLNLPELTWINIGGQAGLEGKELPKEWNSPKLVQAWMARCGMTGTIPAGFASTTPKLVQVFMDQNNFYGVYPHEWAAGIHTLEVFIGNNHANKAPDTKYYDSKDSSAMGYLVPKQLDVRMNAFNEAGEQINSASGYGQGDFTQLKLGGVFEGNFLGYEVGWGQHRADAFGAGVDEFTWHISRTLWDSPAGHSNMGYEEKMQAIPGMMMTWDEAAAEAWTKEAKALNASRAFKKLDQTAQ